jgi:hypothetical protein
MMTQGSFDDFKYFLPRLFEGVAKQPYDYNPEILFGKLRYAHWLTWKDDEIAAVRRYLDALWRLGLNNSPIEERMPAFPEIETLLASIANAEEDLGPYLEIWSEDMSEPANTHLVQFVTLYGASFSEGRTLSDAFWKGLKPQAAELRRWLLRPATIARIEGSRQLLAQDGYEHLFEPAFEILRAEAQRLHPASARPEFSG